MGLTGSNLKLLKYIQENEMVYIHVLTQRFGKTISSIRREIEGINKFLEKDKRLTIKKGFVKNNLNYGEYISFVNNLTIYDYETTALERLHAIVVRIFFKDYVSLSQLYTGWGFSLTTKKKDSKKLKEFLEAKGLKVNQLVKKGLEILGDELHFRILVIQILLPLFELSENYGIEKRKANTPIENEMLDQLIFCYNCVSEQCEEMIQHFFALSSRALTYSSKKLLLLYVIISMYRKEAHRIIENHKLKIEPLSLYLYSDENENYAFNLVIAMLDFYPTLDFAINEELLQMTGAFLDKIQEKNVTHLYTYEDTVRELYDFFCKQIVCSQFNFSFKDKIIQDTDERFPSLFQDVSSCISDIEESYSIKFNNEQITTIILILRKWLIKNKVYGRNVKKIIIVTNISFERMSYFIESLKEYVEFELVGIFDIYEIYKINALSYDYVFAFSDRIYGIITSLGTSAIKLNYFLEQKDIDNLLENGFSTSKRRFVASKIAEEFSKLDASELENLLKTKYSDFYV